MVISHAGPHTRLVGEEGLVDLPVIDLLLNGAAGDEPVHHHLAGLPNAPRALTRLRKIKRIRQGMKAQAVSSTTSRICPMRHARSRACRE